MNSLKVPDSGLRLMGSGGDGAPAPPQAFFLNLEDNTIESMIKAVQSGQDLTLRLGKQPAIKYGPSTHIISPPSDSLPFDLYLTRPFESTKSAERIPSTSSLFKKPKTSASPVKARTLKDAEKGSNSSKGSSSSGLESDYETLRDALAAEDASRGRTTIVDKALPVKRGKINGRAFSPNPASLPPSPALRGVGSPSGPAISASQQALEKSKWNRMPIVHELAVEDRTTEYLREKWDASESEMIPALNKIADQNPIDKTWTMRRSYYKDLDVWNYAYETSEEREKAIRNAVKVYDKMRLSEREPEWERLNAPEDRGKGICLSNLQAKIATKEPPPAPAPKIKVNKAEDGSGSSKDEGNSTDGGRGNRGGENMTRIGSNGLPVKTKKTSAADAQAKRLLSNKPKPAASSATPKVSPSKGKGGKATDGRILSQEIIEDSDLSDEGLAVAEPAPKPKAATPAAKPKTQQLVSKPRPVAREPVKATATKRQREDEDSSSSSGTPLVKRLKGLPLKPKASPNVQKPAPAAPPPRAKDTSPTKSSPLASSPPTNASDMDDATPPPPPPMKKRRTDADKVQSMKQRKKGPAFNEDIMVLTSKFRALYEKYARLHRQIEASPNPSHDSIADLTTMRNRLATMKQKIYGAC
ncbi:com1 [Sarocladium implicatum]|nr:com1 [Sarocladium implicatum]